MFWLVVGRPPEAGHRGAGVGADAPDAAGHPAGAGRIGVVAPREDDQIVFGGGPVDVGVVVGPDRISHGGQIARMGGRGGIDVECRDGAVAKAEREPDVAAHRGVVALGAAVGLSWMNISAGPGAQRRLSR